MNELADKGQIGSYMRRELIKELQISKNYLKTEFKGHITRHSMVADHCIAHALSDQSSTAFSALCGEPHNAHCQECDSLTAIMQKISAAINQSDLSPMEKADLQFQV